MSGAQHTPTLVRLTPRAAVLHLGARRLSCSRIDIEVRIADAVRAREAREALRAEWPRMQSHQIEDCDGHEGWCEACLRWDATQRLNARINSRAASKAEGR